MNNYDVAVIGAGPGGYVSAIRCAQLGLKTICIDKWTNSNLQQSLGGTCLNVGCIPSKALLDSSHLYEQILEDASKHGITAQINSIDLDHMHKRKNNIINNFSKGISQLFKKNKIDCLLGSASLIDKNTLEVNTGDPDEIKVINAKQIIIATGSSPISLPGTKIDNKHIVDNSGALDFNEVPSSLGIIGAGVIGLELGSVWRRLGANVTLLEMADQLFPTADKEISREALRIFKSQGLDIKLGTKVLESTTQSNHVNVKFTDSNGEQEIQFDKLIIAVGRKPNIDDLNLNNAGIELDDRGFIITDKKCRTNIDNIYAIGDVTNGPMLAHRASHDGTLVAENIAGHDKTTNYDNIPWIIYTWPEIAWSGKTEQELKKEYIPYKVGKFPFMANGRAHAMNSAQGFIKIITSADDGKILGVHILGPNASELISMAVSAISNGHTYEDIIDEIHAHPTLSEAMHEAALGIDGRAIHI